MLGLHGGSVVAADALVELLWGDDPPRTAVKAMQTHISALRRALGDGFVLTEGTGWTLGTVEIDATRYKSAAQLGRDAIAAGDANQAVTHFDEALALWRGIPELPDGRRGVSEKTRWTEGHAALVEDRADALLATGRAAEIIGELEAAIADSPLRERRWGHLMLALYRAGRQGEALGAYQRARSLLAEELGVDPGPDLRRLESAIVAQDVSLELPVSHQLSAVTRAVTFLLTDIEGSTAAWEADADAMAAALARHDEIVEQVVTFRAGRLIKTRGEGDATFSVFDRPSGAAAAAIELQEAIRREPWPLADPMRIRVALHTGEVEFRDGDYFGRAVNRAARLRSLATGGQILCSGATAELVIDTLADDVVLADLGTRQLKNLARPEHVFELRIEAEESRSPVVDSPVERPPLPAVLGGSGPFVGRGRELERLLAAWQTTQVAGSHAVLISGEPGVGKTRLAGEWSRHVYEQGAIVLYGRCDEDLGAPYQPFSEALRSLAPGFGTSRLRGIRGIEALIPLVPELTEVLPELAAPPRADPDTERYALFDAVGALLGVAAASAPVILVLDDLHWAAKPTLLLLRHLLRFGEHARIQIVGTYRSTDLDRSHPLAAMLADLHRDGSVSRLTLGGLDEDDVTAYVAEAGYDDEELARALASVTGGNPFFLIEALRHVDESGGRWDPTTLPQGVREAVSRRLSRLPEETNTALATAAVVGSRFELALVERVVGHDLVDAFDESAKAGIVIEEPGGRYRFNHAIVRQSLLAELASVRRMRLHQRIATTLESEPGADDELLAELAYHYFECAWAGNAAKAVDYCRRAADQAMARLAYEGAADLYNKAVHALEDLDDELPDRDEQRAELLVARCEALLAAGDVVAAKGAVSQLQSTAAHSGRLAAWGACFDGQLSMLTDPERLDEIESAVADAAASLAQFEDAAGEAKAHTVRAGVLVRLGRIGDAETALDQALTAARRARDHRRVNAVLAGAPLAALWGPNPVPRAGGRCLDVVRLLRITTGSPVVEATSTRCQGVLDAFRGRASAGRQLIESARRSLTELGMRHALLEVDQFAGIVELVADDPAAAEPLLRRAYNGFRRMGLEADTAETAALLARACVALDRETEADELCTESERLAGNDLKAAIAWRTVRAQLLARGDDHGDARRIAQEAVAIAEHTDLLVDHGDACLALATVLRAAGDTASARVAAEKAVSLYELKGAEALAVKARTVLLQGVPPARSFEHAASNEPDNQCVQALRTMEAALNLEDWDEFEQMWAPDVFVESRRKIVGFTQADLPSSDWPREARRLLDIAGPIRGRMVEVIAVRGDHLALTRLEFEYTDTTPGAPSDELIVLFGMNAERRIALHVVFDVEDIDAAIAELDAQYVRLEEQEPRAAIAEPENACVRVVRRMESAWRNEDWREGEKLVAPSVHVENRRKIVGVARGDLSSAEWVAEARQFRQPGMVRHRSSFVAIRGERLALTKVQVSTVDTSSGAPEDEMLILYGVDDRARIALQVTFDVGDFDAAIAELDAQHERLETLSARTPLENSASRIDAKFNELFAERRWDEVAALWVDNVSVEDRRRVLRREANYDHAGGLAEVRAMADLGVQTMTSVVVATRGQRLTLCRARYSGRDQRPEAFHTEILRIIEIDSSERCVASVAFDLDDFDAASAELDARYLAGEAAPHAHTWTVIAGAYAALDRHEMPPTTPDWVNIDRQRLAMMEPGDAATHLRAVWEVLPDFGIHVVAVHRLTDLGAVVTWFASGTSQQGFDTEQQGIGVLMVQGDLINHFELFDDVDLEAALATFDELSRPAPRLDNSASRVLQRFHANFEAQNWAAMAEMIADEHYGDDRRRVIGAGIRRGRDSQIKDLQEMSVESWTLTPDVIAIRGERLLLYHGRVSGYGQQTEALQWELLVIVETNADEQITAWLVFDPDDIDAAFAELDSRYAAGEAAASAGTWSVIAGVYAEFNRHELPTTTPKWIYRDHRSLVSTKAQDLAAYIDSAWDATPDLSIHVEAVHRLSNFGAVVTHTASGTSREGFGVEWRMIHIYTVDGTMISRCEMFDETDLGAALARFGELHPSGHRLENAASQVYKRLWNLFETGDWRAVPDVFTEDIANDDRRRVVNAGVEHGRDIQLENLRRLADIGAAISTNVIATRGDRLILTRFRSTNSDLRIGEFDSEMLTIIETDVDNRITAGALFEPDDLEAAFAELDERYLAGEAAPHANLWSVIIGTYTGMTRGELPTTTPNLVNIDHRHVTRMEPDDGIAYFRASWDLAKGFKLYIEAVHRLNDLGAVFTRTAAATSDAGFEAEWRAIDLVLVDGGLINRGENFDEDDLDAALARFEELHPPVHTLENVATRVHDCYQEHFNSREWDALIQLLAEDHHSDDRRPVANEGIRHGREAELSNLKTMADLGVRTTSVHLATRGDRLALCRVEGTAGESVVLAVLRIVEIDADERIVARVIFDVEDLDAALAELDARFLAGEAASNARTWSAILSASRAFNRREMFPTTANWVNIDHRRVTAFEPGDMSAYVHATWDVATGVRHRIVSVHRLGELGAVLTQMSTGTSREAFEVEWREIVLLAFKDDAMSRCEIFDETDLGAALARFDELGR
uniref:BTAD domain-containing putative transcriptional regulator n=1 Tax=Mycolicibacterium stellerae TaxID=2358193 RepID=UPI000F0BD698|nr:BTAD domain-containing putative transcriptional regulator [Mycolicibacterium stellerae]